VGLCTCSDADIKQSIDQVLLRGQRSLAIRASESYSMFSKVSFINFWQDLKPSTCHTVTCRVACTQSINPRLLLAVFLPVLLFGSAFTMDWHTVRRQKWAILLLAAPGVALGTILTAVLVKYTFPYDWTWTESLLVRPDPMVAEMVAEIASCCPHSALYLVV